MSPTALRGTRALPCTRKGDAPLTAIICLLIRGVFGQRSRVNAICMVIHIDGRSIVDLSSRVEASAKKYAVLYEVDIHKN